MSRFAPHCLLIIDDHPIMRTGVRQLITARWPDTEVREAGSLAEATTLLRQPGCDAIVLDLSLPDATGLEALQRMHRLVPDTPILVLSMHAETAYAARALKMGARGYLTKDHAAAELVGALELICTGQCYVSQSLAQWLALRTLDDNTEKLPHETLSAQEYRVLLLLAQGHGINEIAAEIHLSPKTVSTYRARLLEKLKLANNADLTRYCLTHQLMQL